MLKKFLPRFTVAVFVLAILIYFYKDQMRHRDLALATARLMSNLYLKAGPGEIFERLGLYSKWSLVSVHGRAPSSNWISVTTADDKSGWMSADFLQLSKAFDDLPDAEISDVIILSGEVRTTDGLAGDKIMLTLFDESDPTVDMQLRTTSRGEFIAYFPSDISGRWTIAFVGASCGSSLMGTDCQMDDYFPASIKTPVNLPGTQNLEIIFENATTHLFGTVRNAFGDQLENVYVLAKRTDGAVSGRRAGKGGKFDLPLANGDWSVQARQDDQESETRYFQISDGGAPEPLVLTLP
jgi:hypothetical protein